MLHRYNEARLMAFNDLTIQRDVPIFTISRNSDSAKGITDRRDCRTNGIPFSGEWFLISRSVTALCSGFTGARSTVDQSPSFAVESRYAVRITFAIPTTALSTPL